jgi:hypothetical protein
MTTQNLIEALANDLVPVSTDHQHRDVGLAIGTGAVVTFGLVAFVYGVQPRLDSFAHGAPFVMKSAYSLMLAAVALAMVLVLARPGVSARHQWRWLMGPVVGLAALAAFELLRLPMSAWPQAMMGSSWQQCPWRVVALSIPVFAGLCVAIRRQAPIDLRATGAAAGMLSGAVAATVYALACTESSAAFVLVWYSLGIALATAIGALLGPKFLRW